MKTFLLILGFALFIIGLQDGIRIVADNQHGGIFGWVPGGFTFHIALDVALTFGGALLAKHVQKRS